MNTAAMSNQEVPIILLIGPESPRNGQIGEALEKHGWRFTNTRNRCDALSVCSETPISLVLIDADDSPDLAEEAVKAIRRLSGPSRAVPILSLIPVETIQNGPSSRGVDGYVKREGDDATHIARELEHWRPISLEPTRRIAGFFGPGQIARMIERLGRRLDAAMSALQEGRADKAEAHRLAGLCGTLGFAQAHAAWLDLSLGNQSSLEEVRRTTRLTLAAIAHGL